MHPFIAKYRDQIQGVVSGFDRLVLRGSLRRLNYGKGMEEYLWQNGVLFKDYAQHVKKISERVKTASVAPLVARKLPVIYHYGIHPEFGWMRARIQTWFPFHIQVCLNGREWLARQMDRERLRYVRQDNCFPWLKDYERAQQLLDRQLTVHWPEPLQSIAEQLNLIHEQIFQKYPSS